jgi:hypothetical protein
MMTSAIEDFSTPAFSTAAFIAKEPSSVDFRGDKHP